MKQYVKLNDNEHGKWFEIVSSRTVAGQEFLTVKQEDTDGEPFEINVNMVVERENREATETSEKENQ